MGFEIGKKYPMRNGDWSELTSISELYWYFTTRLGSTFLYDKNDNGRLTTEGHSKYDIISDTPVEEEVTEEFPPLEITVEQLAKGGEYNLVDGKWKHSDTPIEEEIPVIQLPDEVFTFNADDFGELDVSNIQIHEASREIHVNILEDNETPVFLNGVKVLENQKLGIVPETRRQFDVSKLKKKPSRLDANRAYNLGVYENMVDVLEAWNAGTIEELLEGWTK